MEHENRGNVCGDDYYIRPPSQGAAQKVIQRNRCEAIWADEILELLTRHRRLTVGSRQDGMLLAELCDEKASAVLTEGIRSCISMLAWMACSYGSISRSSCTNCGW